MYLFRSLLFYFVLCVFLNKYSFVQEAKHSVLRKGYMSNLATILHTILFSQTRAFSKEEFISVNLSDESWRRKRRKSTEKSQLYFSYRK